MYIILLVCMRSVNLWIDNWNVCFLFIKKKSERKNVLYFLFIFKYFINKFMILISLGEFCSRDGFLLFLKF